MPFSKYLTLEERKLKSRILQRRFRSRRIAEGLCATCNTIADGYVYCSKHRKSILRTTRRRSANRTETGICLDCNNLITGESVRCINCSKNIREAALRLYYLKK